MGAIQIGRVVRGRLQALLAAAGPERERLVEKLRELGRLESIPACSAALRLLVEVDLPEREAAACLREIVRHREEMALALSRDPGVRVATLDYLRQAGRLPASPGFRDQPAADRVRESPLADPLIGLWGRQQLEWRLRREVSRSRRHGAHLAVAAMQLDSFRSLDERHGHIFADLVLTRVGEVLRRCVRESDVACRPGGAEFTVILPETDRLGAWALAARFGARVQREIGEAPLAGRSVALSVSGGLACCPEDATEPLELLQAAGRALARSRREGGGRITLHHAEQRGAVRHPIRSGTRLGLFHGSRGERCSARGLDLSQSGALLEVAPALDPGEVVALELPGPTRGELAGRVVRVERPGGRPAWRVAVAFERPLPVSLPAELLVGGARAGRRTGP